MNIRVSLAIVACAIGPLSVASPTTAAVYPASGYVLVPFAGDGSECTVRTSPCGDGPDATRAQIAPSDLVVDAARNVYAADFAGKIRKITPTGAISTIAGNGLPCILPSVACGDGGPAVGAALSLPKGLALDAAGNIYVSDESSDVIERVTTDGLIARIAGSGGRRCVDIGDPCGDGGSAVAARLSAPGGLAIDPAGNLYFADQNSRRIRKITPAGVITTIAGTGADCADPTGSCGDGPNALAAQIAPSTLTLDRSGNLYFTDVGKIRRLAPDGSVTTIAGSGLRCTNQLGTCGDGPNARKAQLTEPTGIAVDDAGNVFVGDAGSFRVRRISASGAVSTIAGGSVGPCDPAPDEESPCSTDGFQPAGPIAFAAAVTLDGAGGIFVGDPVAGRIFRLIGPRVPLPSPPAGPGPRVRLAVASDRPVVTPTRVAVRFRLSGAARVAVSVRTPNARTVALPTIQGRRGGNVAVWNRTLGGKPAPKGLYRITLRVVGQTTKAGWRVRLR